MFLCGSFGVAILSCVVSHILGAKVLRVVMRVRFRMLPLALLARCVRCREYVPRAEDPKPSLRRPSSQGLESPEGAKT